VAGLLRVSSCRIAEPPVLRASLTR